MSSFVIARELTSTAAFFALFSQVTLALAVERGRGVQPVKDAAGAWRERSRCSAGEGDADKPTGAERGRGCSDCGERAVCGTVAIARRW